MSNATKSRVTLQNAKHKGTLFMCTHRPSKIGVIWARRPKIGVITSLKNELWLLRLFLARERF